MDAIDYEYLLRQVYNCGRHGVKGADADLYRKLEYAETQLTDPDWNKTQEQKEHDYRSVFVEVRMHVRKAVRDGKEKIKYSALKEEMKKLEEMESALHKLNFYDKKILDEIIDNASDIFRKYGLQAR